MSLEKNVITPNIIIPGLSRPNLLLTIVVGLNIAGCITEVREGIATNGTADVGASSGDLKDGTFLVDLNKVSSNNCTSEECDPDNVLLLECPEKGPLSDGPFAGLVPCGLPFEPTVAICECLPVDVKVEPAVNVCWSKGKQVDRVDSVSCMGTSVFPEDRTYRAHGYKPLTLRCLTTGQEATGCTVNFKGPGAVEMTSGELEGARVIPLYPVDASQSSDTDLE